MAEHPIGKALTSDRGPRQAPGRHRAGAPGGVPDRAGRCGGLVLLDRESLDWHGAATRAPAFAWADSG
jgi:hypothetical protein